VAVFVITLPDYYRGKIAILGKIFNVLLNWWLTIPQQEGI